MDSTSIILLSLVKTGFCTTIVVISSAFNNNKAIKNNNPIDLRVVKRFRLIDQNKHLFFRVNLVNRH